MVAAEANGGSPLREGNGSGVVFNVGEYRSERGFISSSPKRLDVQTGKFSNLLGKGPFAVSAPDAPNYLTDR